MTQAPEAGGRKFLHVGCGHKRKGATIKPFAAAEWQEVTLDIDEAVSPDLIDGLPELASVPTGAFDAVYSAHNLEHLFPHEVAPALAAFRRVLKDDGFAVITCPDLQTIGDRLAADDLETPLYTSPSGPVRPLDILYGFSPAVAKGAHYMAHRGGFTLTTMREALKRAGFPSIGGFRRPKSYDFWVLALKSPLGKDDIVTRCRELLVPDDIRD